MSGNIRLAAEQKFQKELQALSLRDQNSGAKIPPGWKLSPLSVLHFIIGCAAPLDFRGEEVVITEKYIGNAREIELCIATLCSDRALMMIGPPGTAKSCLSEWLAAAISGTSRLILQGNSGVTEDQIKYSWNFSLLLQKGPTKEALKPSPIMLGMGLGQIVRFEEVTRCAQEVQDALISILSEKEVSVPEMGNAVFPGKFGFNIIGTANTLDRGVHDLSSALKRRFNFVTIPILTDKVLETRIIEKRLAELCKNYHVSRAVPEDLRKILITVCQELREGRNFLTSEAIPSSKPDLSTAEIISLIFNSSIHYSFFKNDSEEADFSAISHELIQTLAKDDEKAKKLVHDYAITVLGTRAGHYKSLYSNLMKLLKS